MAAAFGHRWTSSYGASDDGTWLECLRDLTPEQLRQGLARSVREGMDWPPSLGTFRLYCTERPPAAHQEFPPELEAPRDRTLALAEIAKMKRIVAPAREARRERLEREAREGGAGGSGEGRPHGERGEPSPGVTGGMAGEDRGDEGVANAQ